MFIQFQFISYITGFLIFPQYYTFSATQIHGHTFNLCNNLFKKYLLLFYF